MQRRQLCGRQCCSADGNGKRANSPQVGWGFVVFSQVSGRHDLIHAALLTSSVRMAEPFKRGWGFKARATQSLAYKKQTGRHCFS
jgi:hypothetical protein